MIQTVPCGPLSGTVTAPASKSQAHRLLICAALGTDPITVTCNGISRDIAATIACLRAMGAVIRERDRQTFEVTPIAEVPKTECRLPCGESGSTLRFLLPVAGALGLKAVFHMEGRLPQRPMKPLTDALSSNGMKIEQQGDLLYTEGKLSACDITLPGDVSSQYISGLLMAMPLLEGKSSLQITGKTESVGYIQMTEDILLQGDITFEKHQQQYCVTGRQRYRFDKLLQVEGDYSGAAFFLCAGAFSSDGVTVCGLDPFSSQGDRAIIDILRRFGAHVEQIGTQVTVRQGTLKGITVDAADIPDLIPVISMVAAAAEGKTYIINASRLRLKESDRLYTTAQTLQALGVSVQEQADGLTIDAGALLHGATVNSFGDHRIAMSAAIAAGICDQAVTVTDAECVQKSYVSFWEDLQSLKPLQ